MTTDREQTLVELVDDAGQAIGSATVAAAHTAPGQAHRAFSVLLYDERGRVLLQQRAAAKTRFALRWSNTCCGHPGPGDDLTDAACRRLQEELGIDIHRLTEVGVFRYQATDPATGRVEHEHDHVLTGKYEGPSPQPDPAEVAAWRWMSPDGLSVDLDQQSENFTPWLSGVLSVAVPAISSANRSPDA